MNRLLNTISLILIPLTFLSAQNAELVGDLNSDSLHNVQDIIQILNIILEYNDNPSEYQLWAADVNVDSQINIQDIVILVSVILHTYDACPEFQGLCPDNLTRCCYEITSHDFNWQIEFFGTSEQGMIFDCTIISPSNIVAVGKIQIEDVPGGEIANSLHWDGSNWELVQVVPDDYSFVDAIYSIFSFDATDIWTGSGGLMHFNGDFWELYNSSNSDLPSGLGRCYHIWGSGSDVYHSRISGDVIHWDGQSFSIMETTTGSGSEFENSMRILDLYGLDNTKIWTIAGHPDLLGEEYPTKLSFYNGEIWIDTAVLTNQEYIENELCGWIKNVWAFDDTLYVSTNNFGVWKESISTGEGLFFDQPVDQANYTGRGLSGNHYNDLITVSWSAKYAHFNGEDWDYNDDIYNIISSTEGVYNHYCIGVSFHEDIVVMYGSINSWTTAWIAIGTRNNQ